VDLLLREMEGKGNGREGKVSKRGEGKGWQG